MGPLMSPVDFIVILIYVIRLMQRLDQVVRRAFIYWLIWNRGKRATARFNT